MSRILPRKLLLGVFYLFVISFAAFFMSLQMPGDPAQIIANQGRETEAPVELVERIRKEYGFDKSWIEQYFLWLGRVVTGNLGYSTRTHVPVAAQMQLSLPITLRLASITFLVTVLVSFPLGIYAGVTRNQAADAIIQAAAWTNYALPVFLVANLFIWLLAVKFRILPSFGHESWRHYILPVAVLSLHLSGWMTQVVRASVREVTGQHYILAAGARGVPRRRLILVHTLKPALLPIVTALLIQLGNLVSGSVIVETVFAWNGVGRLLVESIMARDFPMIQGIVLYIGSVFAVINVLIDVLYGYLDPSAAEYLAGGR